MEKLHTDSGHDRFAVYEAVTQLLDAYLVYRRAVASVNTALQDERMLAFFRRYLQETHGQHDNLRSLALGFIAWLKTLRKIRSGQPYARDTLNCICERVYAMFRWAEEEGYIEKIPLKRKELIKRPEPLPKPFTPEEVRTLLQKLSGKDWQTVRNRAIVITCLELGCRRGELLQMTVGDLKRGYSEVRQKGNRLHVMHLTTSAREAIQEYLHALRRDTGTVLDEAHPLWLNGRLRPMHGQDLRKAFERLGKRIGMRLYIHRLRATSATLRLAYGASTEVVRRALGHSTDRVLRYYVGLSNKQQREAMELTSPIARILDKRKR
ncbi:MAG: tyrosine-type recombinase/integrase, partial [Fimbriimonadales bacterium]|nr:tyrosine-type recombinase/integrase [Fimbriimonadales bacterium]